MLCSIPNLFWSTHYVGPAHPETANLIEFENFETHDPNLNNQRKILHVIAKLGYSAFFCAKFRLHRCITLPCLDRNSKFDEIWTMYSPGNGIHTVWLCCRIHWQQTAHRGKVCWLRLFCFYFQYAAAWRRLNWIRPTEFLITNSAISVYLSDEWMNECLDSKKINNDKYDNFAVTVSVHKLENLVYYTL